MDRKEQILEFATELVQTRGYTAFSYADLSEHLGITKASIHYHFPTKEALGDAIAQRYRVNINKTLADARRKSSDPWRQIEAYFRMVLGVVRCRDRICAAGSVQSEFNVVPGAMREEMCSLIDEVIDWIAEVLAEGRRQGVMEFAGTPADQAAVIFSCMQGAMQHGRAMGLARFRRILDQVKRNLKAA